MEYPPTTQYLLRKLNHMARKLKAMNDLPAIKDWMEAMNCIFETLQAFSGNNELSAPMLVPRRKWEIHKAQSITIKPVISAVKTVKKVVRPLIKGKRSIAARSLMKPTKVGRILKRSNSLVPYQYR